VAWKSPQGRIGGPELSSLPGRQALDGCCSHPPKGTQRARSRWPDVLRLGARDTVLHTRSGQACRASTNRGKCLLCSIVFPSASLYYSYDEPGRTRHLPERSRDSQNRALKTQDYTNLPIARRLAGGGIAGSTSAAQEAPEDRAISHRLNPNLDPVSRARPTPLRSRTLPPPFPVVGRGGRVGRRAGRRTRRS
jgi:hypothetical protein